VCAPAEEKEHAMRITYLRDTSPTGRTCPTLYSTDRGTFLVQGKKIGDACIPASPGLRDDEDVVEVPARLLEEIAGGVTFPASGGLGLTLALIRAVPRGMHSPSVCTTSRGSFIVRGVRVTDPEALAAMDIPDDETAIEVPAELLPGIRTDVA
jgi:hypothetical protein